MPKTDLIDWHNERTLDTACTILSTVGRRAIGQNPHGRLVLTVEWKNHSIWRRTISEEASELLTPSSEPVDGES